MCGIFGIYSFIDNTDLASLRFRLLSAQRALHHRGPNDSGLDTFPVSFGIDETFGSLSLGHTRLSIIDLSSRGHQPMHSRDGRYTIVFNGEIYNYCELRSELKTFGYTFETDSDTEELMFAWAHWGIAILPRLTGMFAFVVYDREDQSLTLVRDAFGIKPLFYSLSDTTLGFASELPALLRILPSKPELDPPVFPYGSGGEWPDRHAAVSDPAGQAAAV